MAPGKDQIIKIFLDLIEKGLSLIGRGHEYMNTIFSRKSTLL